MKLTTVLAIVERDRSLEILRSRHSTLRRAAGLYLQASHAFFPWPPAWSVSAFDHSILQDLNAGGIPAINQKYLAILLKMLEATAAEYLEQISRKRSDYAGVLVSSKRVAHSRRCYPSQADIDRDLCKVAAAFEHAGIAFGRDNGDHDAQWALGEGLIPRVHLMQHLLRRMDSALRRDARQARAERYRLAQAMLGAVAIAASALTLLLLGRAALFF